MYNCFPRIKAHGFYLSRYFSGSMGVDEAAARPQ